MKWKCSNCKPYATETHHWHGPVRRVIPGQQQQTYIRIDQLLWRHPVACPASISK